MFLIITMLTQLSVICKDRPYERGIIIFLNELKIVEITKQDQNKTFMPKLCGPSEIHVSLLGFPGSGPMYRPNPLS
jgi:hypothetical protein